jgi:hypothetical protein
MSEPSSSVPDKIEKASESTRPFLQSRLSQYAKFCFLIQIAFTALWVGVGVLTPGALRQEPSFYFFVSISLAPLIFAATWWLAQGEGHSPQALWNLEAACSFLACGSYAFVACVRGVFELAFFPVSYLLLLRAAFLPSTGRRTLAVNVVAYAPSLLCIPYLLASAAVQGDPSTPEHWLFFLARLCVAICIPALVSQVLYGLREEVREARKLGPYTLEQRVGGGGMGEVYRARHALLRRDTAIKLLRPDAEVEEAVKRFEQEVQITSQLTHPNTVEIYDYGRNRDGQFYYAMEYLPGITLGTLVEKFGPQPPARVIHLLRQVCGSIHEAHSRGTIHRDLKPENLILCERGGIHDFVKVVDFGLMKKIRTKAEADLTAPNVILGTVPYIPPEALDPSKKLDARSDLYALGAVGYLLLTGRPPFAGEDLLQVAVAQMKAPPERPSKALGAEIPADLEDVILSCLDKEVDGRPSSAHALEDALSRCSEAGKWTPEMARSWWKANHPAAGSRE